MSQYFIGLDIGTNSVGWAVTDPQYKVVKKNGKGLWGVRLFDEAHTAEERRTHRIARRRLERRNQRIEWLRQVFSKEIAKVDPAFFLRLDESKFLADDKRLMENGQPLGRYTLFADKEYCDKDYHKQYPTIYHLRKALITNDGSFDVRLVYLAVHHILKKRGHFLFGDMKLDDVTLDKCIESLRETLQEEYSCSFTIEDPQGFKAVLLDRTLNITKRKKALWATVGFTKNDKQEAAVLHLLAGASVRPSEVCQAEYDKEADKSFSFQGDFENIEADLIETVGEDMRLIYAAKRVYDCSVLEELRNGEQYLSFAKVKVYEQHNADLKLLKKLLKADPVIYREVFRVSNDKLQNYPAYSGHGAEGKHCKYEDFAKYLKAQIKKIIPMLDPQGKAKAEDIIEKLDLQTFLPKQTSKNNGVIPHQLHEQELQIILDNASRYLPFLNQKDDSGLSRKEQILAMFKFRIPYYVGPLYHSGQKDQNCWVVRSNEKIFPWNFEKVVDLEKSAENFITRMTATCSYIGEPILPKDSLLYSRFVALNMINKIKINGQAISVDTKQKIYQNHILPKGRTNMRDLKSYLVANGLMMKSDELSGLDENFRIALTGQKTFERILFAGDNTLMVEDIIRHIILFGEDRKLLERWIKKEYGNRLSSEDIAYIVRQKGRFSGWGTLSSEFLTEIKHINPSTQEGLSIIDALWQTNENLMELLSDRYSYGCLVEEYRRQKYGSDGKRTLEDMLDDSYASPAIRRSIRQTIQIISEIEKIMGSEPTRIFLEVAREKGENDRTPSRKAKLMELYAACKKEEPELYQRLEQETEEALRSNKLYLYYTQLGRCMYSGKPIELSRLETDYDIDHIYPQSMVKDDSQDNKVLVKKELNAAKSDAYPISGSVRSAQKDFWRLLKAKKLISEEKYQRLTRSTRFTDQERSGFIARQLVETRQTCKIVADLLKARYQAQDKVVYVKAGNVASFRQDQRILPDGTQKQAWKCNNINTRQDPLFVKCREVNDFHHAKDAYLNIVVGNVYHVKFTRDPLHFIRQNQEYSLNRMFDFDVVRGQECAWKKGEDGSIATVRRMMCKNNILLTRYAHEGKGGFFDQMIVGAGKGQAMIKSGDPRMTIEKFGGYNKLTSAYFFLVEHTVKKARVRTLETVLLLHKTQYEKAPLAYCEKVLGLLEPQILIQKIMIDSLLSLDGFRMHLSGRHDNSRIAYKNANELILNPEDASYIKRICKYLERCKTARKDLTITQYDAIAEEDNKRIYRLFIEKLDKAPFNVQSQFLSMKQTLLNQAGKFEELSLPEQCRLLMEVLKVFSTAAALGNLSAIGAAGSAGRVIYSKNVSSLKGHQYKLIHQSVTGFFEQEIDLLGDAF